MRVGGGSRMSKASANQSSMLTRYLQSALAKGKITVIGTISPATSLYKESIKTVCFATRVRSVVQTMRRNEPCKRGVDPLLKRAYEAKFPSQWPKVEVSLLQQEEPVYEDVSGELESRLRRTITEEEEEDLSEDDLLTNETEEGEEVRDAAEEFEEQMRALRQQRKALEIVRTELAETNARMKRELEAKGRRLADMCRLIADYKAREQRGGK